MSPILIASVIAGASALGLWWNFVLARRGKAADRDRFMGGVWAALLVLSLAMVVYVVVKNPQPTEPAEPPRTPGK